MEEPFEEEFPEDLFDTDDDEPFELDSSHFFAVDTKFLTSTSGREFDIYIEQRGKYLLYRSMDTILTKEDTEKDRQGGRNTLYILNSEREKYLNYIEGSMLSTLMDDTISASDTSSALYNMSTNVVSDILANPESKRSVNRGKKLIKGLTTFLNNAPDAMQHLFNQDRMESYIVTHCINVAIFGLGIATRVGVTDPEEVQALGLGCLLHDVGKQIIPQRIINKPGKLSPQEWVIVKRHPDLGVQLCKKAGGVSDLALRAIVEHHERLDGSGYPRALKGDDIHLFGRICAAADVLDAITSDRPFQDARDTFPALKEMKNEANSKLDPVIFIELVKMLQS